MGVKPEPKPKPEPATKHTVAELLANADVFNVAPEILAGALYGKTEATRDEAAKLLAAFVKKEVDHKEAKN